MTDLSDQNDVFKTQYKEKEQQNLRFIFLNRKTITLHNWWQSSAYRFSLNAVNSFVYYGLSHMKQIHILNTQNSYWNTIILQWQSMCFIASINRMCWMLMWLLFWLKLTNNFTVDSTNHSESKYNHMTFLTS